MSTQTPTNLISRLFPTLILILVVAFGLLAPFFSGSWSYFLLSAIFFLILTILGLFLSP